MMGYTEKMAAAIIAPLVSDKFYTIPTMVYASFNFYILSGPKQVFRNFFS